MSFSLCLFMYYYFIYMALKFCLTVEGLKYAFYKQICLMGRQLMQVNKHLCLGLLKEFFTAISIYKTNSIIRAIPMSGIAMVTTQFECPNTVHNSGAKHENKSTCD